MSPSKTGLLTPRETPNDEARNPFGAVTMTISPVFKLDAELDPSCAPDLAVLSSDDTLFYAHSKRLLRASRNAFSGLLPASPCEELGLDVPVMRVQQDSTVLDLILHALHGLDMAGRNPSLDQLALAVEALLVCYAVPPGFVLAPGLPLFRAILAHAVAHPLQVYIIAAHYDVDPLAVSASTHMLSYPLMKLTDDEARAMGAVYLRRLFCLHIRRAGALRSLLIALTPPAAHGCDANEWALAVATLVLDATPDTSPQELEAALKPLLSRELCAECRRKLEDGTQKLVAEWSAVKGTI